MHNVHKRTKNDFITSIYLFFIEKLDGSSWVSVQKKNAIDPHLQLSRRFLNCSSPHPTSFIPTIVFPWFYPSSINSASRFGERQTRPWMLGGKELRRIQVLAAPLLSGLVFSAVLQMFLSLCRAVEKGLRIFYSLYLTDTFLGLDFKPFWLQLKVIFGYASSYLL